MSTVYTINGKVLKNSANDKWLTKKETPPVPQDEVTIGTQTWKNVNLEVDDGQGGITVANNVTANGVNMGTQYYYTWAAAVRVSNSISGWHLPSKSEWETLFSYVGTNGGLKLCSTSGWNDNNGTDDYGFNALPVGLSNSGNYPYGLSGDRCLFWSSTESGSNAYRAQRYDWDSDFSLSANDKSSTLISVRLIKDT